MILVQIKVSTISNLDAVQTVMKTIFLASIHISSQTKTNTVWK